MPPDPDLKKHTYQKKHGNQKDFYPIKDGTGKECEAKFALDGSLPDPVSTANSEFTCLFQTIKGSTQQDTILALEPQMLVTPTSAPHTEAAPIAVRRVGHVVLIDFNGLRLRRAPRERASVPF